LTNPTSCIEKGCVERDVSRVVSSNGCDVGHINAADRSGVHCQLVFDPVAAWIEAEAELIGARAHVLARNPLGAPAGHPSAGVRSRRDGRTQRTTLTTAPVSWRPNVTVPATTPGAGASCVDGTLAAATHAPVQIAIPTKPAATTAPVTANQRCCLAGPLVSELPHAEQT
jgi:hypothetical protein